MNYVWLMSIIQGRQWHPTPVLLPGKSHGWRSLVGCSPWGGKESDMTEWLHFHFSLSCIGEGNGNPLQCSCLENPRNGASWWAAIYGVAQSRIRLKWLSSNVYNWKYEIMLSRITHVHTKSIAVIFLSLHCGQYLTLANFLTFANLIEEGWYLVMV